MATQPVDLKGMTFEQVRAWRAEQTEKAKKREEEIRSEKKQEILDMASRYDIDLAQLAREIRIFRNPNDPWDTWSGKGRKPKWLREWEASGRSLDELETKDGNEKRGSAGPAAG